MKLTPEEFLEIRARRSQDDMKVLIAYVEDKLGVDPVAPAPPAAASDRPGAAFLQPDQPQTTVAVADPVPAPQPPYADNPPTDIPESENVLKRKADAAARKKASSRKKSASKKKTAKKTTAKKRASSKRSSKKAAADPRTTSGPPRQDLATGTFRDTPPTTGTSGHQVRVTQSRDSEKQTAQAKTDQARRAGLQPNRSRSNH